MNANCLRVLLCLVGAGGLTAVAAEPNDPASPDLLNFYSYQPPPFINPSTPPAAAWPSQTLAPLIAADARPDKPVYYDFRHLEEEISEEKTKSRDALFSWKLFRNQELEVVAKPKVQEVNIPWSPMIAMDEVPVNPTNATRKVKVGLPLVRFSW